MNVDITCKHTNDDLNYLIYPTSFSIIVMEDEWKKHESYQ